MVNNYSINPKLKFPKDGIAVLLGLKSVDCTVNKFVSYKRPIQISLFEMIGLERIHYNVLKRTGH